MKEIQDNFLNEAKEQKRLLTVHLTNGVPLRGVLTHFNSFTVVLDSDGKQQLIYKKAISTMSPIQPLNLQL